MRAWALLPLLAVGMIGAGMGTRPQPNDQTEEPPTLTVTGEARVAARPDRATVRLGAVAQAEQASAAQQQVNQVMQAALDAILALGVPRERISTAGLSLHPVYSQPPRPVRGGPDEPYEPRIVGYRASNTIQVQVDDLPLVGKVIDAGVNAGANQLEGITFGLRDDLQHRQEALRQAARNARAKAVAIAEAMEVRLGPVREVVEGGADVFPPPRPMMERMAMADMAATPVEPGEVQVRAQVTVRYRIRQDGGL